MTIDLGNVEHIRDINLNTFAPLSDSSDAPSNHEMTVKVNHNTFNVRILDDGQVDVSFKSGWFLTNLFRGDTLRRVKQQLQEAYASFSIKTTTEQVKQLLDEGKGVQEIIHYGFHDPRKAAYDRLNFSQQAQVTTIDEYNINLGLTWESVSVRSLESQLAKIREEYPEAGAETETNTEAWGQFLKKNIAKLDVFGRISSYIDAAGQATEERGAKGWAGVFRKKGIEGGLRELLRKNIAGVDVGEAKIDKSVMDLFVGILRDLNVENRRWAQDETLTPEEVDEARSEFVEGRIDKFCRETGRTVEDSQEQNEHGETVQVRSDKGKLLTTFENVVRNMFFRQTSKLGLSFMNERKTHVIFQWQNYDGQIASDEVIGDKWWKNDQADIHEHYGVPITTSEMRRVQARNFEFVHRVR